MSGSASCLSISERQQIYTRLAPVIGEEEAQALLDQFPSSPDADPVTVVRLDQAEARLDARIDQVETRLNARIDQVEARLDHRISQVEASLNARIDQVEASLGARIDQVEARLDHRISQVEIRLEAKIDQLRSDVLTEMHRALRQQTILMLTTVIAVVGFIASTSAFG